MSLNTRRFFVVFVLLVSVASSASAAVPAWNLGEWGRAAWSAVFGGGGEGEWVPRKAGCGINPDGTPRCAPTSKAGCEISPDGTPRCAPAQKHGCSIDPDGSPRCAP